MTVPAALRTSAAHVFVESLEHPVLADGDLHHLRRVLRVRDSDPISVSDGAGRWRIGRLVGDVLEADGPIVVTTGASPVTVATAIPKGDRVEWMVQKLTELGVGRIVLVDCARSVVRWDGDRGTRQIERLRRISREAAMQSRQVHRVDIRGPVPFATVVADRGAGVVIADPDGAPADATTWQTIVIGPEGGLTADELGCGAPTVSLGEHVLRIETAALVAAVLGVRPTHPAAHPFARDGV